MPSVPFPFLRYSRRSVASAHLRCAPLARNVRRAMMRRRLCLLFLLVIAATPAHAHGVEGLIYSAFIYGTGVGIAGGVVNGLVRKEKVLGLIITMVLYFLAGLGFAVFYALTVQPIPDLPPISLAEIALIMAVLQAYGGIVPLVIGFLCAHVLARFAMRNAWRARKT